MKRQLDLMVTHSPEGPSFGTLSGRAVSERKAKEIQADLFVRPSEDGLFPGFTQTWKVEG